MESLAEDCRMSPAAPADLSKILATAGQTDHEPRHCLQVAADLCLCRLNLCDRDPVHHTRPAGLCLLQTD